MPAVFEVLIRESCESEKDEAEWEKAGSFYSAFLSGSGVEEISFDVKVRTAKDPALRRVNQNARMPAFPGR